MQDRTHTTYNLTDIFSNRGHSSLWLELLFLSISCVLTCLHLPPLAFLNKTIYFGNYKDTYPLTLQ